jgi:hypothetical protein
MACYAPNTPLPTSSTQIGYSYTTDLTRATTTTANSAISETTTITNVPVGVWMIYGNVLGGGSGNAQVLTYVSCQIHKNSASGDLVSSSAFSTNQNNNDNPISYLYLTPTGVFHSDGLTDIIIIISVRSSSTSTTSSASGSVILTKIA